MVRRSKRPNSTKIRRLTRHQPGVSALRPAVAGNSLALPGHHTPTLEKLEEICGRLRGRPMPPLKSKAFGRPCVTTLTQYDVGNCLSMKDTPPTSKIQRANYGSCTPCGLGKCISTFSVVARINTQCDIKTQTRYPPQHLSFGEIDCIEQ